MLDLPVSTQFFFIRHGETDWNVQQRLQGSTDIPLNENGRLQAEIARNHFVQTTIDRIISSNLLRAWETATIINNTLNKNLHSHSDLQERNFGILEGLSRTEIEAHPSEKLFHDITEANGRKLAFHSETLPDFDRRVANVITEMIGQHANETILFVSHGGVFASLCRMLLQETIHSQNAVPYRFLLTASGWELTRID